MMSDSLPQDVQDLLRGHVESYEHLAILLLVYCEPMRRWSEPELSERLRIPPQLAADAVSGLLAAGLLSADLKEDPPRYRYAASGATDGAIGRLALEYTQDPTRVVRLLNAIAIERVRTSAVRAFADSFVLKKKDRDRG
jgi:hypothetical protein